MAAAKTAGEAKTTSLDTVEGISEAQLAGYRMQGAAGMIGVVEAYRYYDDYYGRMDPMPTEKRHREGPLGCAFTERFFCECSPNYVYRNPDDNDMWIISMLLEHGRLGGGSPGSSAELLALHRASIRGEVPEWVKGHSAPEIYDDVPEQGIKVLTPAECREILVNAWEQGAKNGTIGAYTVSSASASWAAYRGFPNPPYDAQQQPEKVVEWLIAGLDAFIKKSPGGFTFPCAAPESKEANNGEAN